MFAAAKPILTLLATAIILVRADINPNNPGPGDVFVQGQTCMIGWDVDTTGAWKAMNIDLMTGDNMNMVFLTSVAKGLDGTNPSKNTYSFTCPQVSPHSAIYFYQFSSASTSSRAWTGRFTITDTTQHIVAPSESTQPDGTKIPWGKGVLVAESASSLSAGQSASLGSLGPGPATHLTATATPSVLPGSPSQPNTTSSIADNTTTSTSSTSSTATPSTVLSSGTNGVVAAFSVSSILFQVGLGLGFAAFWFAATL